MMCVHGISLEMRCSQCNGASSMACSGPGEYKVPGKLDEDEQRFVNAAAFHASSANDRLATELASLTRSIQGLSGNVAKLLEEKGVSGHGGDEIFRTEPLEMTTEEFDASVERNRKAGMGQLIGESMRQAKQQHRHAESQMAVRRCPLTDGEIAACCSLYFTADTASDGMRDVLNWFAKSRGLID